MEHTDQSMDDNALATNNDGAAPKGKKRRNPFNIEQRKEEKEKRQKKRARLIVRNISYKITEETLRKHFEQWGTLEDVKILKRADGKLVGCAFVQYENINQATKAILKGNKQPVLGRPVYIDWALGKDEYISKKKEQDEPKDKKPKIEIKDENGEAEVKEESDDESNKSEVESAEDDSEDDDEDAENEGDNGSDSQDDDDNDVDDEDKKDIKSKLSNVKKEKHISNDVQEGCTVFIKNVSFDAEDADLRKACRKFGPLYYVIINREPISGHSKGTAFVKFKTKESADLCLQAGPEFTLLEQVLESTPALSREEIKNQASVKSQRDEGKDSRNLYLAREGLIMSGSKAADDVSASDMAKRHKLEQIKTQVLKNLNRFVSRNRLSIHNLPLSYDNEKLNQMLITYTGFRPHECRVMRENRITPEHPKGKSKGFGFMSFNTHQEALTALRKLNNHPKIFGTQHRPIVAFSIEDRAVHKVKEKRAEKSKLNNPTFQDKMEKRKEQRKQQKATANLKKKMPAGPQSDNKVKLQKHIKKLEATRAAAKSAATDNNNPNSKEEYDNYVGTAAKPGTSMRMRSNKKIKEQSQEHKKRVKGEKRKEKQRKIRQIHLAERKAIDRPKQGRKVEKDDLQNLVNKYKRMIDSKANEGGGGASNGSGAAAAIKAGKPKKPKRTKWYKE